MAIHVEDLDPTTRRAVLEAVGGKLPKVPKATLVDPAVQTSPGRATWIVPLETRPEANGRDWRKRSKRSNAAWRAVSKAFGPNLLAVGYFAWDFHKGKSVKVTLTRLGGKRLDPTVNLPSALKGVEDAVAFFFGADDGAANWQCVCGQEPGGPMGVRITLEAGRGC